MLATLVAVGLLHWVGMVTPGPNILVVSQLAADMNRRASLVVSTPKPCREPRRRIAATPAGIESWRYPVVFVNTSARKGFGAEVAVDPPHAHETTTANTKRTSRKICFAIQQSHLVLTTSIKWNR